MTHPLVKAYQAAPEAKPLGLVWVKCPNTVHHLGLERELRAQASVHRGQEPPVSAAPSLIVLSPGEGDVFSEVECLREALPGIPLVVLGSSANLLLARTALQAGARGFVHVGMPPQSVVRALSVAQKGEVVVPRDLLKELHKEASGESSEANLRALSARQIEILELVAEGLSNAQIAQRLWLSESTIKQHLRKVYKVLEVKNRNQAATLLRRSRPHLWQGKASPRRGFPGQATLTGRL
jgi:DNA-binding NarL/FixJ family response regulator